MTNVINLAIEWSDSIPFAFTLRRTNLKNGMPTQEDYQVHVENLIRSTDVKVTNYVYERTGGLHMHGIFQIPKKFNLKRFRIRGWKMHLEEIYDYDGWKRYMAKEQIIKYHENELAESEHPVHRLRRLLFKDRNTEPASVADATYAPP